jgi:hypothetical protein
VLRSAHDRSRHAAPPGPQRSTPLKAASRQMFDRKSPAATSSSSCNFLRDAGPDPRADAERVLYAPRSATRSRHARRGQRGCSREPWVRSEGPSPASRPRLDEGDGDCPLPRPIGGKGPWRSPPGEPVPGSRAVHGTSRCTSACELADPVRVVGSVGWSSVTGIVIGLPACRDTG